MLDLERRRVTALAGAADAALAGLGPELAAAGAAVAESLRVLAAHGAESRIVMAGTANLARSTNDFAQSITPVLEALEEQVVLLRLLSEMELDGRGIAVRIGSENTGGLAETSVVATGYGPSATAKMGVLGPTRMDYPASMAAVRAVARYLSRILAG